MEKWIEELATNEIQVSTQGVINSTKKTTRADFLNHSCEFLSKIRLEFIPKIKEFNNVRKKTSCFIKMYSISGHQEGFMLFRNHYKMVFVIKDYNTILVTNNSIPVYYSMQQNNKNSSQFQHRIEGKIGSLGNITWTFKDENVETKSLVKYYLTRFIRESFSQ